MAEDNGGALDPSADAGPSDPNSANPPTGTGKKEKPALSPPPPFLKEDRICIAERQFSKGNVEVIKVFAELLAASIVPHGECNIFLTNPRSLAYKDDMAQMASIKLKYPKLVQPTILPYHWLLTCFARRTRIDPSEPLTVPSPIIVSPDRSADHGPLKVWVSVNINRTEVETDAEATQSHVQKELLERGALVVDRRSIADILVVDRNSRFFSQTIMKERHKYGRKHQRIVERDWVDDCVKNGRMVWPPLEMEQEEKAEVDSMAEDEPVPGGRGPGRPTGKPRVDYTPADADFLCRYLAAYHSGGSWMSRKTYQTMSSMVDQYPIIARHSDQSWHEHFKKNSGTYEARVKRYIAEGLDRTLKTEKEREVEREKKRVEREREAARRAVNGDGGGVGVSMDVPPLPQPQARPQARARARPQPPITVSMEDVDALIGDGPSQAGPSRPHKTVGEREGARLTQMASAAIAKTTSVPPTSVSQNAVMDPVPTVAQAGPSKRKRLVELDEDPSDPSGCVSKASPRTVPPTQRPESGQSDLDLPVIRPEPVTQRSDIPAGSAVRSKLLQPEAPIQPRQPIRAGAPAPALPSELPRQPAPKAVAIELVQVVPLAEAVVAGPQAARPIPSEPKSADPTVIPTTIPAKAEGGPKSASTQSGRPETASRAQNHQPGPSTSAAASPAAAVTPSHDPGRAISNTRRFFTPAQTPGGRQSLMQQSIRSSESKRRRMMERAANGGRIPRETVEPDMVYVSKPIVPASQYIASRSATPNPLPPPRPARSPSPPLSRREREAKVVHGHSLVLAMQLEYREKVNDFAIKYNILPSGVVKAMDELKGSGRGGGGGGQMYWDNVEEALKERFGY